MKERRPGYVKLKFAAQVLSLNGAFGSFRLFHDDSTRHDSDDHARHD